MATVLGAKIKQARLRAGLTQAQLARATQTSERNIVRWETSANAPRMESLAAIARATGHTVDDLLGDDEDEEAAPSMHDAFDLFVALVERINQPAKERVSQ